MAQALVAPNTLVIGIGNPLRGDDRLGWAVAEEVAAGASKPRVTARQCHQLTPELAEALSRVGRVVFIDADLTLAPGEVACTELFATTPSNGLSHRLDPSSLLYLCQALYGRVPRAHVVSVGPAQFGLGESLSPCVLQALPAAVGFVEGLLAAHSPTGPG